MEALNGRVKSLSLFYRQGEKPEVEAMNDIIKMLPKVAYSACHVQSRRKK